MRYGSATARPVLDMVCPTSDCMKLFCVPTHAFYCIFNKSVSCLKSHTRACVPAGGTTPASRRRRPPPARHLAGVPARAGAPPAPPRGPPPGRPPVCAPHSAASSPASSSARHALCCLHALPGAAAAPLAGVPARAASGAGGSAGLAPGGPRALASAVPASRAGSDVSCVLPAAWTSAASAHGSLSRRCISCATAHRHFRTLHNVHACSLSVLSRKIKHPSHQYLIRVRELHLRYAASLQAPVLGGLRHTTARFFKALDGGGAAGEVRHLAGVAHARAEAAQRGLVAAHLPQRVRIRLAPPRPPAQGRCVSGAAGRSGVQRCVPG